MCKLYKKRISPTNISIFLNFSSFVFSQYEKFSAVINFDKNFFKIVPLTIFIVNLLFQIPHQKDYFED